MKTVHRHQCDLANGAFDYEHGSNGLVVDQASNIETVFNEDQQNQFNIEQEVRTSKSNETTSNSQTSKDDQQRTSSLIEECRTEQYELMKHQLFQKGKFF